MNWFKKQLNKLFDNEIEDDENYYDDLNYEEENSNSYINENHIVEQQNYTKRSSFRFPLIADDELDSTKTVQASSEINKKQFPNDRIVENPIDRPKNFYQPNAISKVYDVEVSGIKELLEKRQRIKGYSNVLNQNATKIRKVEKPRSEERIIKEVIKQQQPIRVKTANNPQESKRRFIPTDVPSPVYGYKKPSNIGDLLEKKQNHDKQQITKYYEEENDIEASTENVQLKNNISAPSLTESFQSLESTNNSIETINSRGKIAESVETVQLAEEITSTVETIQIAEKASTFEIAQAAEEMASSVEAIQTAEEMLSSVEAIQATEEKARSVETVQEAEEMLSSVEAIQATEEKARSVETVQEAEEMLSSVEAIQATEEKARSVEISQEAVGMASSVETIQAAEETTSTIEIEAEEKTEPSEMVQATEETLERVELEKTEEIVGSIEREKTTKEIASIDEMIQVGEEFIHTVEIAEELGEIQNPQAENMEVNKQIFEQYLSNSFIDIDREDEQKPVVLNNVIYENAEEIPILAEEVVEAPESVGDLTEQSKNITEETESDFSDVTTLEKYEEEKKIIEPLDENLEKSEQPKGSKLPFNVLMLKSDKEKYAAKLAQKEMQQHNDDIKEISRHSPHVVSKTVIEQTTEVNNQEMIDHHSSTDAAFTEQKMILENIEEKEDTISELNVTENIEKASPKIYKKPSLDFLSPPEEKTEDREWMESQADVLVEALSYFQVTAQVESIMQGPAVTQFEITVGHGTKVSKIRNLADDLKLALAAKDIRIQAPIPGKSSIGIEIPNRISRAVRLSEVTSSESFRDSESPLEAALGLDLTGKPVTIDLRKMPHGLIAGATGSGKSVCINSILVSLLYKADPHELKLMLIDPKMVELAPFNHIPHLVSPVITDVKAATAALKWAVEEMERRYQLFAHAGVRDLPRFNKLAEQNGEYGHKLPYILIVIDELADLMMMSPADVEEAICRIAQKARACGIHLIVATQRPSVDVITGLIKSNIPTRIAFAVSSQVDSRTILDSQGAERLLGRGDMLYLGNGMSAPIRLQGTFVTDDEIEEIIEHIREQGEPDYFFEQDELLKKTEMIEETDELFEEVCRFVYEQGTASTSSIQRKYHIGYNRAARLIDMLESHGFISEQRGSKPREVFITDTDLTSMFD
ncbi:DNA translocase FtsK [Lysinibacillus telephonicus]|uniref:DNA translocase FtsK n=1 Tax=Lysinibacillus telephonicus TaxID=1714840 RepID=UPI003B9EA7DC